MGSGGVGGGGRCGARRGGVGSPLANPRIERRRGRAAARRGAEAGEE